MAFAKGKCIVTKQEGPCLVLPAGTLSPTRQNYISKEGCDKLLDILRNSEDKVKGVCVINRKEYDNCIFIPRGVINPKIRFLMSPEAIEGMASQVAEMPLTSVKTEEPSKPETPPPPPEETSDETDQTSTEETPDEAPPEEASATMDGGELGESEESDERTDEDRRIKTDEPLLDANE